MFVQNFLVASQLKLLEDFNCLELDNEEVGERIQKMLGDRVVFNVMPFEWDKAKVIEPMTFVDDGNGICA